MPLSREHVLALLDTVALPDGGTLVSRDVIRALDVTDGLVRFVVEAPTSEQARLYVLLKDQITALLTAAAGVQSVQLVFTAHGPTAPAAKAPASAGAPPALKIGQHPTPQVGGAARVTGVDHIIAIASGKGGVGKSTVSSNLAVALARQGRRVGLLDADIYGPSQPRMMGVSQRPASPDGKIIIPLQAHGVTVMSIGLMLKADEAVIWRGPMIMGALQQLLTQVQWGRVEQGACGTR